MFKVTDFHALSHRLYQMKVPVLPQLLKVFIRIVFGCYVPYQAKIGKNTILGYNGIGVVIHHRCVIGDNCVISQGVTLGGTSKKFEVPRIGNKVYVGAGAKIIGAVTIGDNVVIGANAVVLQDIPSNCVAAGIPAKIVKRDINISDYF